MQKFIFLGIGLVLNLLEDAVGRLRLRLHVNTKSLPIYRKNDRKVLVITVHSTTLDEFYCDFLYIRIAFIMYSIYI